MPIFHPHFLYYQGAKGGRTVLDMLKTADKVVGAKQVRRALNDGRVSAVFLAEDADPRVTDAIAALAEEKGVRVERVPAMKELGKACSIAVSAAVAATLLR